MYIKDKMVIDSVAKAVMSIMDEENKKLLLEPEDEKHEDEAEDKKLIKKMVKKSCQAEGKGNQPQETFTDNNMGEMTDAQMKDRERIVKSMKKGIAGFKERYGKRAKDVMYATATKQAMKSEAAEPKESYGETEAEDGPARKTIKGHVVDPKEYKDRLDKKYAKPGPFVKEATENLREGSGPKEKQKTPYRNINSSEYRAAANKQKEKMEKDDAETPGKKLLSRLKGGQYKLDKNHNGKLDAHDFKLLRGEKNESVEPIDELSKNTVTSYALKAGKKLGGNIAALGASKDISKYSANPTSPDEVKKRLNKSITNRTAGLAAASQRLSKEEVEIEEADHLTMRGLHTANPQSIPSYMRSTEKGKKSLADKNRPILKQIIKGQLGKHPKPNLPEEVEGLDELSKGTLMSYIKKADKQQGKNFDDIVAANKNNDQPKANKANAKYINRERGQDRAVSKMYAKYDKPKTKRVLQFEGLDEKLNPKKRTTDTLSGRTKGGDDNQHTSYKVALEDENKEVPTSRAKSLAIEAYRKIKKESMLGQVGTSEEKKK